MSLVWSTWRQAAIDFHNLIRAIVFAWTVKFLLDMHHNLSRITCDTLGLSFVIIAKLLGHLIFIAIIVPISVRNCRLQFLKLITYGNLVQFSTAFLNEQFVFKDPYEHNMILISHNFRLCCRYNQTLLHYLICQFDKKFICDILSSSNGTNFESIFFENNLKVDYKGEKHVSPC